MSRHDPCCSKCRTPWGVCATQRSCNHHRDAEYQAAQAAIAAEQARESCRASHSDDQRAYHTRPRGK
jgi:hypothetical protein